MTDQKQDDTSLDYDNELDVVDDEEEAKQMQKLQKKKEAKAIMEAQRKKREDKRNLVQKVVSMKRKPKIAAQAIMAFGIKKTKDDDTKVMRFDFTPQKIMLQLSMRKLQTLGKFWKQYKDGLNVVEFVQLMLNRIYTYDDDEKYELVYGSYKLFMEVDINGDGNMEWAEFMQYIIDAVSANTITGGDEEQDTVTEQIAKMRAKRYTRFSMSPHLIDKTSHPQLLQRAVMCNSTELMLCFERNSDIVKFYDYNLKMVHQEKMIMKKSGFVTSIAYDDKNKVYGISTTDGQLHFYTKSKIRIELLKTQQADSIQTRIYYLPKQKLWLTSGRDLKKDEVQLHHWSVGKSVKLLQTLGQDDLRHTDEITDCIEIHNPQCIATCSLDKKIVFYDVMHRDRLRIIDNYHEKGIRHLRYQNVHGPQMVSIGNEIYANVWAPESMVSDIHIGRLKGHKKAITDGQYLNRAPFFVTVDETNLISFWDIFTLVCIQQISSQQNLQAEGIVALSNNVLWVFGKRFFQFDTFNLDKDDDGAEGGGAAATSGAGGGAGQQGIQRNYDAIYPKQALINDYLLNIFVVRKQEVRMYDIEKGELKSIHMNIFQENPIQSEITTFKIDKRHRKAYVANSAGTIYVINCQSGVVLKNVTQFREDRQNIERLKKERQEAAPESDNDDQYSMGSSRYSSDQDEAKNLIEADPDEEEEKAANAREKKKEKKGKKQAKSKVDTGISSIKKAVKGGKQLTIKPFNQKEEIMKEKLRNPEVNDMHLIWEDEVNLIMMICSNAREYMVFDEQDSEQSKLLRRVFGGHEEEITICAYDFHLSLVATGCINGEIIIYDFEMSKVEGLLRGHQGDITAIEFLSPYPLLMSASADCSVCIWGVRPCPSKLQNICLKRFYNMSWEYNKDVKSTVSRILVWKDYETTGIKKYRRLKGQQLPIQVYRNFEQNFVFSQRPLQSIFEDEFSDIKEYYFNPFSEKYKIDKVINGRIFNEMLNDQKEGLFVTQVDQLNEPYQEALNEEKDRFYAYIGDEHGYLKIWDLNYILDQLRPLGIEKCKTMVRSNFNPRRQELVDCGAFSKQLRRQKPKELPVTVEAQLTGLIVREIKAHSDIVTSISKIKYDDCEALITASRDCWVRVWSKGLDLHGQINQKQDVIDPQWNIPTNQMKEIQKKEIETVENIIQQIDMNLDLEKKKLIVEDKPKVKAKRKVMKQRANWLILEQEQKKKEQEMAEKQQMMEKQYKLQKEKGQLIEDKIDGIINQQEQQFDIIKKTIKQDLQEDGPLKGFKTALQDYHKNFLDGTKELLPKQDEDPLKIKKKQTSKKAKIIVQPSSTKAEGQTAEKEKKEKRQLGDAKGQRKSRLGLDQKISAMSRHTNSQEDSVHSGTPEHRSRSRSSKMSVSQPLRFGGITASTSPRKKNKTLMQMVEEAEKKFGSITQFTDSKMDRQNILSLKMVPSIRNKLESLQRRDRFAPPNESDVEQSSPPPKHHQRSQSLNLQMHQQRDQRLKQRIHEKYHNIQQRHHNRDYIQPIEALKSRPLSIADSEIQRVSDLDPTILNHELSLGSLQSSRQAHDVRVLGHHQNKRRFYRNQIQIVDSKPVYGLDPEQSTVNETSLPDINQKNKSRLIQIEQVNINLRSERGSVDLGKHLNADSVSVERRSMNPTGRTINLQECNIRMPQGSAIFESKPKIIHRNPFQDKFAAAEAMISERSMMKKYLRQSQLSPITAQSKNMRTEVSKGIDDFRQDGSAAKSTLNGINSNQNIQFNRRSNYLTVDATSVELNSSARNHKGSLPIQTGLFSSLDQSAETIGPATNIKVTAPTPLKDVSASMLIQGQQDLSTLSKRSLVSIIDLKKNQDFESVKQKYTGENSTLLEEQKKLRKKLEDQREKVKRMKKNMLKTTIE